MGAWADTAPASLHLWDQTWFLALFYVLCFLGVLGVYGFIAYWKWRSISPILIACAGVFELLHWSFVAYVILAFAFLVTAYCVSPDRLPKLRPATNSELESGFKAMQEHAQEMQMRLDGSLLDIAAKEMEMRSLQGKYDSANIEVQSLKATLDERFPKFTLSIGEIIAPDPELPGNDTYVAILVGIANNGAKSIAQAFQVTAKTVYGAEASIEVTYPPNFRLVVNDGKDMVEYAEEHYIMKRALTPIERGCPINGILPCRIKGIKDVKSLNLSSLKISCLDGIGDQEEKGRRWESEPFADIRCHEIIKPRLRIGLPMVRPIAK